MEMTDIDFNLPFFFFFVFLTQVAFLRQNCAQGISSAQMVSKLLLFFRQTLFIFLSIIDLKIYAHYRKKNIQKCCVKKKKK